MKLTLRLALLMLTPLSTFAQIDTSKKSAILTPGPIDSTCQLVFKADGCNSSAQPDFIYSASTVCKPLELAVHTWTLNAEQCDSGKLRGFVNFPALSTLPKNIILDSVRLVLYGFASGASATMSQGNSTYPGSPYNIYGPNEVQVQRVLQPWKRSTLTWNNQPTVSAKNTTPIPPSDKQFNYNVRINVTSLVKDMMDSNTFYGFRLAMKTETVQRSMGFYSNFESDVAKRPSLEVYYHTPLSIADNDNAGISGYSIYPNPATGNEMTLAFSSNVQTTVNFQLIDYSGKVVYANSHAAVAGDNKIAVPVQHVAPGNYLVRIWTGENVVVQRFSKL